MKKWLITILKKLLRRLEPNVFDKVTITHSYKPLITLEENIVVNKRDVEKLSEGCFRDRLAQRLSEQIIDHMDISYTTCFNPEFFEEQVHYRAKIQIADNRN